jgi:hypothetical protein
MFGFVRLEKITDRAGAAGRDSLVAATRPGITGPGTGRPSPSATPLEREGAVIRKLKSGEYRLYSRKKDPKTGKRRNLGTFKTRAAAEAHERAVQFFKRRG